MKMILLTSALLLSQAQVEKLDKAWLVCQRTSVGMVHTPDSYCVECFEANVEWPKDGYPQCKAIYEAERERGIVRDREKKLETERKQKVISNFLDSVVDMLK